MTGVRAIGHAVGVPSLVVTVSSTVTGLGHLLWEAGPELFLATGLVQRLFIDHIPGLTAADLTPLLWLFGAVYLASLIDRAWEDIQS